MAWHAKKSASGSKQWIKCPGSLAFVEALPAHMRRPTGAAAMLGTCAHALGEHCLREGLREVPPEMIGMTIILDSQEDAELDEYRLMPDEVETAAQASAHIGKDVKFFTRVDEKMRDGVQLYLDVVWEAFDEMGEGTEMLVEERFDMDWLRPGLGGTSDCTLYQFLGLLRIIDYKNGYVAVSAEDNTQALTYALGVAHRRDWMCEEVEVVIVQPNSRGEKVKRWRITVEELRAFQDRLAQASDMVDEATDTHALLEHGDAEAAEEWASTWLHAGEDDDHGHCTFCDALAVCPAAKAKAEELAASDFAEDPPEGNPLEVHDEAGLERLVRIIKWGKWLDGFVKAAQTLGQRRLEQGLEVPGHKLVRGKANRAWSDSDEQAAAILGRQLGLKREDLFVVTEKFLSPAQAEKLGAPRSKERKKAKELVEQLAFKPEGKLAMAPISDPREEVVPQAGAADDFVDDLPWEADDE